MWQEIDEHDKGKVSRDAMFHHLKEARDINIQEDAHVNQVEIVEEKKEQVASILASVPIKKEEKAKDEDEAFGDIEDEKAIDERWNKKMKRAMTIISITEDDHPCWAKVDEIWAEYSLSNNQQLNTVQAKDYVSKYAKKELGMTTQSESTSN